MTHFSKKERGSFQSLFLVVLLGFMFFAQAETPPGLPLLDTIATDPFSIPPSSSSENSLLQGSATKTMPTNIDLIGTKQETLSYSNPQNIYALSITGQVKLNSEASSVKVILIDNKKQKEYLVYETYPLLTNDSVFSIQRVCEESCILPSIPSFSLRIELENASISVHEITYSNTPITGLLPSAPVDLKAGQNASKIQKLNEQDLGWVAGETPVSMLTYEEKKRLFLEPIVPNLQGFEFYLGGIFEIKSASQSTPSASSLISNFDWRNRHGENWMTSVKNQKRCGSCWAFAATGATEAITNLYFNQHLDLDLAEQDALSCSGAGSCNGGWPSTTLNYFKNTGIVSEACFTYSATDQSCSNKCSHPNELINISGKITFGSSNYPKTEDTLKRMIIENGPVSGGIYSWKHAMTLVGFEKYTKDGKIVWMFKNSWGGDWGDSGYGYIKLDISDIGWTHALQTPIISSNAYSINCVDKDGDQFCNWGISKNKPSTCPDFCKAQPDCDDSDPNTNFFDANYNCGSTPPPPLKKQFTVYNDGNAILSVTSITPETNAPWITVSPTFFTVAPNTSKQVSVFVNSSLIPTGQHRTRLLVASNDPNKTPYPSGVYINVNSSTLDSDADGYTDKEEIAASSDPFNANSIPSVSPTTCLTSISTRAIIEGGAYDMIAGFIITGTGTQKLFKRGRSLQGGVNPYLKLEKFPSGDAVGSNNDWQEDPYWSGIPSDMSAPLSSTDAGMLRELAVGPYVATLSSMGTTGLAIVELIAIDGCNGSAKFQSLSTRAPIRGGLVGDVIAGIIISGTGTQKVFIRGRALEAGVNPFIELYKYPSGELVDSNDNWQDDSQWTQIPPMLSAPLVPTDAGMLKTLPAGAYTATLSSVGSSGLGIIEVQAIDE